MEPAGHLASYNMKISMIVSLHTSNGITMVRERKKHVLVHTQARVCCSGATDKGVLFYARHNLCVVLRPCHTEPGNHMAFCTACIPPTHNPGGAPQHRAAEGAWFGHSNNVLQSFAARAALPALSMHDMV